MARRVGWGAALLVCAFLTAPGLDAQDVDPAVAPSVREAESSLADLYIESALASAQGGAWDEALRILDRARDFSDVSSDLSYLRALALSRTGAPAGAILSAVREGLEAARWRRWTAADGRLLESSTLLRLRSFEAALSAGRGLGGPAAAAVRLAALLGAGDWSSYRAALAESLAEFPADVAIASEAFSGLAAVSRGTPTPEDRRSADLLLSRLPVLLQSDPSLAIAALPFMTRTDDKERTLAAYRAVASPADPRSIAPALDLGLLDDRAAVAELFGGEGKTRLDAAVLVACRAALRSDEGRAAFDAAVRGYSGRVDSDEDGDGYSEARATYASGALVSYAYDADQDGLPELSLRFSDGLPTDGEISSLSGAASPSLPQSPADQNLILVRWFRYPYVQDATYRAVRYFAAPAAFSYAPVLLTPLISGSPLPALRFPRIDRRSGALSERSLISFASALERKSDVADGAVERISLVSSIPVSSEIYVGGLLAAMTRYEKGFPVERWADLDLDGRMEILYRYGPQPERPGVLDQLPQPEETLLDADGDGAWEYRELRSPDGSITRYWDDDGDGDWDIQESTTKGAPAR